MATAPVQLDPEDVEIPSQEPESQIPAFEQSAVGTVHQQVDPNTGDGTAAHVNPGSSTIHVTDPSQYNGGTPQHEDTHVYEGKVQPITKTLFGGGNGDDQNYGGTPGLEKHNAQGKTIDQLNPEQRAEVVGDSWAAQKKVVSDAKTGNLKPGELDALDRQKAAAHPTLQQLKNEGDNSIDVHPAAPGLPPSSVRGNVVAADPLLGGEWAAPPKEPPKGATDTMAVAKPKGLAEPGNLPIWNRPTVHNADGSHSSELSFSREENGKEVLVPSVVNGKFMTPDGKMPPLGHKDATGKYIPTPQEQAMQDKAWAHYQQTGEHLGKFDNPKDADAYANVLHNRGSGSPPAASNPGNHFVKPGTGAKLSAEDAQQYLVKAKGNKDVARGMAKHDGHTF